MSIFDTMIKTHNQKEQEKKQKVKDQKHHIEIRITKLSEAFLEKVKVIVLPLFEKFKDDLNKNGWVAEIYQGYDGDKNPHIDIYFFVDPEQTRGQDQFTFRIKANLNTIKVEHSPIFNNLTNRAIVKRELNIDSLNDETINNGLKAFLSSVLNNN